MRKNTVLKLFVSIISIFILCFGASKVNAAKNDEIFLTYESKNLKMLDGNITEVSKNGLAIMSS